jgi:uncharacterized protein YyaL (SSP411 family)
MNRLAQSSSLYLQQHADNPVAWHPWDETALAAARSGGKPILLSIGYSACHWCHVMAHECFEDPATAQRMNELFVNIKVDREERPDLDRVYQLCHQLLTGRGGGWPLTVFLDPQDLAPFFAGTYFPPQPRHGLPAFPDLLVKLRQWFDQHRDELAAQNEQLAEAVASLQRGSESGQPPGLDVLDSAHGPLRRNFDARHGGFGAAPKFPQAPLLALVQSLAMGAPAGDPAGTGHMLRDSLTRMALSGLRDHLDGGFFRYAVDESWTIPHFEKMLYDNAMLLPLYAEVAAHWDDRFLAQAADGIVSWLTGAMRQDNGGFSASIDADAAGVEGGFHLWQPEQVEALLEPEEYREVAAMYGLLGPANFEGRSWHLLRRDGQPHADPPAAALHKLAAARDGRVAPVTDTKQLTSWNALCIEGLARAGMALDRPGWLELAEQALAFIRRELWHDGRLYAVFADGRAQFPAYLDDYAGLLHAILSVMESRWLPGHLEWANSLADALLERFNDSEQGGFFLSSADTEVPIHRLQPRQDDALPSGNGVAVRALLRLGHLTGEQRFLDAASGALAAAGDDITRYPLAHASLLLALQEFHTPPTQVIVTGGSPDERAALQAAARSAGGGRLRVHCYAIGPDGGPLPGILGALDREGSAVAMVCRGLQCLPAVSDAEELARLIEDND